MEDIVIGDQQLLDPFGYAPLAGACEEAPSSFWPGCEADVSGAADPSVSLSEEGSPQSSVLSPGGQSSGAATPLGSDGSPNLVGASPNHNYDSSVLQEGLDMTTIKPEPERPYVSAATAAAAAAAAEAAAVAAAAMAPASLIPMSASAEKKRRGKRKRDEDVETVAPADPAALRVRLPRDTLLRMTSCEVQNYMHQLAETRPLTAPEERELKRLKRLVKNRESAQLSRQRKRDYVDKLEAAIRDLTYEGHNTKNELARSRAEVEALRENVWRLRHAIEEAGGNNMPQLMEPHYPEPLPPPQVVLPVMEDDDAATPLPGSTPSQPSPLATPAQPVQPVQQLAPAPRMPFVQPPVRLPVPESVQQIIAAQEAQVAQQRQFQPRAPTMARGLKTAGVCVLIVLFSFGLFFNSTSARDQQTMLQAQQQALLAQRQAQLADRASAAAAAAANANAQARAAPRKVLETSMATETQLIARKGLAAPVIKAEPDALVVSPPGATAPLAISNANLQANLAKSWSPKNISYMMCNDVTRYDPPTGAGFVSSQQKSDSCVLGFLVPYSSINGSGQIYADKDDVVEITCNVLDINIIPRHAMPLRT